MATFRHALVLAALLGAVPASAQSPDPAASGAGRRVAATGQTKPLDQAEMIKAQKAAEARSKAWDVRTRRSMGSICNGC